MKSLSYQVQGYLLAGGGAALFSMKAIIIKIGYGDSGVEVDAILLLGLRMAFALPVYLAIGIWMIRRRGEVLRARLTRRLVGTSFLVGLLGYYLASYLDFVGLMFITAQLERLVLFTYPLFVMILGALFFGGRLTRWGVCSLILAYSGIALVYFQGASAQGEHVNLGVLFVLSAALSFALYQLLARSIIRQTGSVVFTCIAMSSAAMAALLHLAVDAGLSGTTPGFADIPARIYLLAALLGIAATVLPSFMINAGLERIGAQASAVTHNLSPFITIALAVVILGEPFTWIDGAGAVLVILGVGFYSWNDTRRAVSPVSGSAVLRARPDDRP
ncbi:MAG TPA: DMT family transporter [Afifellaceae bacterium]|nr:DMT family transporter [Afifellaceae bacterium]